MRARVCLTLQSVLWFALFIMPAAGDEKCTNKILIFKHGKKMHPAKYQGDLEVDPRPEPK